MAASLSPVIAVAIQTEKHKKANEQEQEFVQFAWQHIFKWKLGYSTYHLVT